MFNSISGTITAKLSGSLYIDNNGIEWDIAMPSLCLDLLGPVGSKARVFTWLYHREDQMRLFGFSSSRERDLFLDLMKVDGIGPKQAIKILSSITVHDLESALDDGDLARLQTAPGIGTKTAQKMILALKGKLTYESEASKGKSGAQSTEFPDVVNALSNMGFDRKLAESTVAEVASALVSEGIARNSPSFEKELFHRSIVGLSS